MPSRHPLLLALPLLFAACDAAGTKGDFTARDSAGVHIVEHTSLAGLRVRTLAADTPEVRIGSAIGDPQQVLEGVDAGTVLPDGRIVLLNSGSSEIRFYSLKGQMITAQGMEGEGPGEYSFASRLFVTRGDSIVVWDDTLRRATVLSPAGDYTRVVVPEGRMASPRLEGVFADGSLLIVNAALDPKSNTSIQTRIGQDLRFSPEGRIADTLGAYPERTEQRVAGGETRDTVTVREVPFSAETRRAVAGSGYWVGTTAARQIERHDATGALKTIVRWTGGPLDVTDQDKQAYVNERIMKARSDEERAALRTDGVGGFEFAATLPTHGPLLVDAAGNLWVSDFVRPETFDPVLWTVIGTDGVARSRVELPSYATPLWAGTDRVLVRITDEMGMEFVELWKIDPEKK